VLCADGGKWNGASAQRDESGGTEIHSGVSSNPPSYPVDTFDALGPALIRFSSGTTGTSKGVVISHQTLLDRVTACNEALRIGPGDRVVWILPMAHHFAVSIVLYLLHGATTILQNSHLGEDVFKTLEEQNGTVLYAAPFHYTMLCGAPDAHPIPSLRLAVSTAAALPAELAAKFSERFSLPLTQGLGIIEVGLPILNTSGAADKPGAIGRPGPAFDARLADDGELELHGPGMFDAYLSPWQARDEILRPGGWFATGDLATRDSAGDFTLIGRKKSLINVGGMKVFPEEVESVLREHPEISAARIIARDHPALGQVPCAEILPTDPDSPPSKPALLKFCRARLSGYKVPMLIQFVPSIPTTASGKLLRH
jgi:long-chain acyl-CoA synthetase